MEKKAQISINVHVRLFCTLDYERVCTYMRCRRQHDGASHSLCESWGIEKVYWNQFYLLPRPLSSCYFLPMLL